MSECIHTDRSNGVISAQLMNGIAHGDEHDEEYGQCGDADRHPGETVGNRTAQIKQPVNAISGSNADGKSPQEGPHSIPGTLQQEHPAQLPLLHSHTAQHTEIPPPQGNVGGDGVEDIAHADEADQDDEAVGEYIDHRHQISVLNLGLQMILIFMLLKIGPKPGNHGMVIRGFDLQRIHAVFEQPGFREDQQQTVAIGIAIHTEGEFLDLIQYFDIGQSWDILLCQKIFAHGHGIQGEEMEIFHRLAILCGPGDADEGDRSIGVGRIFRRDLCVIEGEGLDQMTIPVGVFEVHSTSEADDEFDDPGGKLGGIHIDHSRK